MTTSGVTAWSLTARDIVKQALQELGVCAPGEEPEASEMEDAILRLNAMLKTWQTQGNLFRETTGEVTVTGGQASGTLDAEIRDISSVRLEQSGGTERPLYPFTRTDYLSIPNKAQAGNPSSYYVSRQRGAVTLYVWPVPATDATLHVDYSRVIETVTNASETLDVPEEWQGAVIYGLASELGAMFGSTRVDPQTVARIDAKAARLYAQMLDADRPDSYRFTYEGADY